MYFGRQHNKQLGGVLKQFLKTSGPRPTKAVRVGLLLPPPACCLQKATSGMAHSEGFHRSIDMTTLLLRRLYPQQPQYSSTRSDEIAGLLCPWRPLGTSLRSQRDLRLRNRANVSARHVLPGSTRPKDTDVSPNGAPKEQAPQSGAHGECAADHHLHNE